MTRRKKSATNSWRIRRRPVESRRIPLNLFESRQIPYKNTIHRFLFKVEHLNTAIKKCVIWFRSAAVRIYIHSITAQRKSSPSQIKTYRGQSIVDPRVLLYWRMVSKWCCWWWCNYYSVLSRYRLTRWLMALRMEWSGLRVKYNTYVYTYMYCRLRA